MIIFLLGFDFGIDYVSRADAGLIALRIMNGAEAQDFDIDPRESLSPRIRGAINRQVDAMVEFTFGHEFAHLLLGHVSNSQVGKVETNSSDLSEYSYLDEYDADLHAVMAMGNNHEAKISISHAAYNVFLCLYVLELTGSERTDYPKFSVSTTHPGALDRLNTLRHSLRDRGQPSAEEINRVINSVHEMKDLVMRRIDASTRNDLLTVYGSIHLSALGGKPSRDRIDF